MSKRSETFPGMFSRGGALARPRGQTLMFAAGARPSEPPTPIRLGQKLTRIFSVGSMSKSSESEKKHPREKLSGSRGGKFAKKK